MKNNYLPTLTGPQSRPDRSVVQFEASEAPPEAPQSGFKLNDILFIFFRHKWKIALCTLVGMAAAGAIFFILPFQYESQAKLLVRYVVDRSAIDGLDQQGKNLNSPSESAINSEVEILTSSDLAREVADKIGIDRLLPKSDAKDSEGRESAAIRTIVLGLEVTVVKGSSILSVSYRNKDPKLAVEVLQELVTRYFDKHLEIHRSLGAFNFVSKEADRLKAELDQTEEKLRVLKAKAGVNSLAADTAAFATELAKAQDELNSADGELIGQQARIKEIEKLMAGSDNQQSDGAIQSPPTEVVGNYQALVSRVAQLRQIESELLARYTPKNPIVRVKHAQINDLEKQRLALEKTYPGLVATMPTNGNAQASRPDIASESVRLTADTARAEALRARVGALEERGKTLAEFGPQISQLERARDVQETSYKYYEASLEKARVDESLDPSRMPNISVVQTPSLPEKAKRDVKKIVLGLAGGGLAAGLAFALLIELVLDRTIKRSSELENRLRIPLLLSIPNFSSSSSRLRLYNSGGENAEAGLSQSDGSETDAGELLRPYCEAIRDRLGLYFEVNRMTHRPKLVAITGMSKNAGASTLAAGLASTLSETDDGHKVLLVDKPVAPKRFYDMLTEFKASDLDYVIFDMPSLGEISSTVSLAGFMDKVLLVVEAEKSSQEAIKKAYTQLASKADVSVVFNKSRSYGVKWLDGEI
jgi:uncharacterized protein involved in exopolysaccharide biosynthesis